MSELEAATFRADLRKLAAELGVSASTVWRHWQSHGLKPHVVQIGRAHV